MTDIQYQKARKAAEEARHRFEDHDPVTFEHSVRVARWAMLLSSHIPGFGKTRARRLEITALLHDYGKTFIDRAILAKRGPLTDAEWLQVRRHPRIGAERVPVPADCVEVGGILWHHKHFDGGGYPEGPMAGFDLPLEARIIAVSDVFDALTSVRPYYEGDHPPRTAAEAVEQMREFAGRQLDPSLTALFAAMYKVECDRVGGTAGIRTLQVASVIGLEVERARDMLASMIGQFDPRDPLKGRRADQRLVDTLTAGLVGANLDATSAENIARYVLRMPLKEAFQASDMLEPPRKETIPPGTALHHMEVLLKLRRVPPEVSYTRVVAFMGQIWLNIGERREGGVEVRLAR